MMTKYDPIAYMHLVAKEGVTHSVLVPTQIVGLISCPQFDASKLKTLQVLNCEQKIVKLNQNQRNITIY